MCVWRGVRVFSGVEGWGLEKGVWDVRGVQCLGELRIRVVGVFRGGWGFKKVWVGYLGV